MGLMQLMPGTWVELGVRYGFGLDPFDPRHNVFAGIAYLREMHDSFGSAGSLRPTMRVRRGTNITSQQGNRSHRTPWLMSSQSQNCSATNTESAPHLVAGVQFLGGSLRYLSAASTHATDYRCASVMLQHRNSLLSSRRVFHAKTVPAELSFYLKTRINRNDCICISREWLRIFGRLRLGGWALGTSDRGGQDKARKVRAVGCGWVERRIPAISANLCSIRRNLRLLAKCYCRSAFDTL
jgi:hypothetical protein